jgi:hypothetical protein
MEGGSAGRLHRCEPSNLLVPDSVDDQIAVPPQRLAVWYHVGETCLELGARHLGTTTRGGMALEPNICESWCACLLASSRTPRMYGIGKYSQTNPFNGLHGDEDTASKMVRLKVRYALEIAQIQCSESSIQPTRLGCTI